MTIIKKCTPFNAPNVQVTNHWESKAHLLERARKSKSYCLLPSYVLERVSTMLEQHPPLVPFV